MAYQTWWRRLIKAYKSYVKDNVDHCQSHTDLNEGLGISLNYIVLIILASLISALGLIMNNSAVIIGAMIISPLMRPIISAGFAFATNERTVAIKAVQTIGAGMLMAIACSACITLLSPVQDNTAEIMARTSPNILDLGIALLCGLAGVYAFTFKNNAESVVGVAISVALMPPLCVAGFGLATMQPQVLMGGFFLFLTNISAIFIISTIVFLLLGFHRAFNPIADRNRRLERRKLLLSVTLLAVLSLPLFYTLNSSLAQKALNNQIEQILTAELEVPGGSRISYWKLSSAGEIVVQVNTNVNITSVRAADLQAKINQSTQREYKLRLIQVPVVYVDGDSGRNLNDYLQEFAIKSLGTPSLDTGTVETTAPAVSSVQNQTIFPLPFESIEQLYPRLKIKSMQSNYDIELMGVTSLMIESEPLEALTIEDLNTYQTAIQKNFAPSPDFEVQINCHNIAPESVYYDVGQKSIPENYVLVLNQVTDLLNQNLDYRLEIVAYSSSTGDETENLKLSQERGDGVKEFLVTTGKIDEQRISVQSTGEETSNWETELEIGHRQQRRADLLVYLP